MNDRIPRIARSASWREAFIEGAGFRCHYCNRSGGPTLGPAARAWHVDHMEPLASGGADHEDNLALACKRCNIAKGVMPYRAFRAYARVAFWNEARETATDRDLDVLLDSWVGTHQGTWSYHLGDEGRPIEIWCRPNDEISNTADELVGTVERSTGRGNKQGSVADFVVWAHRLVPHLIAEVRTLRAELAEARKASAEAPSESAA